MNLKFVDWKSLLPYITAIFVFIVVTFAYFNPLLEGKRLNMHDITMHKGMSKEIMDFREETGEEALWTNSMFGGMPAWQISVVYTGNLIRHVKKLLTLWMPFPANAVFMYFLGFFILLLALGVNPWLSMTGALAFGFSSYFFIILGAGHTSKAYAIGYMAPVLAGIVLAYKGKVFKGGILAAIALALQLEAGHLQITYYLLLIIVILGLFQLVDALRFKQLSLFARASGFLIVAATLATLTHGTNLYATYDYGKESMRGSPVLERNIEDQTRGLDRSYITHWSYGIGETWSLLIPNAKGGASGMLGSRHPAVEKVSQGRDEYRQPLAQSSSYWGDQPGTSGPVYSGAIVVFLFVLGLFLVKGKYKWILLGATVLSILLSWGKNFMPFTDFFLDYVPGYNKFRAVSMTLVIADLTIPLLGFMGLYQLYKNPDLFNKSRKYFYIAFGLTGGLSLLFYLFPTLFFNFLSSFEEEQFAQLIASNPATRTQYEEFMYLLELARAHIFRADAVRSFIYILLAAAAIYAFGMGKLKQNYLTAILTLLILTDMVSIANRYVNDENFVSKRRMETPFQATAANREILKDNDLGYRVLDISTSTFNDATASYFHHSIGGYHGAKLKRYQDIIDYHLQREIGSLSNLMQNNPTMTAFNRQFAQTQVLNMLNTRYVIYGGDARPIPNYNSFGNAWFVSDILRVDHPNDEIDALAEVDLRNTAVIHTEFDPLLTGFKPEVDTNSLIELNSYTPNHLVYSAKLAKPGLAVFSQIWYTKGWNAYLNGEKVPLIRANYILRALKMPAGEHTVEMKFEPRVWHIGQTISLISSLLLILLGIGAMGYWLFNKMKTEQE
jgi:hypothetical protein